MPQPRAALGAAYNVRLAARIGGLAPARDLALFMDKAVARPNHHQQIGRARQLAAIVAMTGIDPHRQRIQPVAHRAAQTATGMRRIGNRWTLSHNPSMTVSG